MSTNKSVKESAKDILIKIKALFDSTPPATTDPASPIIYTLQDGTQISIAQAGDIPAIGDVVTIAGTPAPAGVLTLTDGTLITCDATGTITDYTAAAGPATSPVAGADGSKTPAPAAKPNQVTPAQMAEMLNKFAVGTPEERLINLETISKALMQSEFGWQIMEQQRLADTNAAIAIYNNTLKMAEQKATAQQALIQKQEEKINGLFELVGKLVELPSADPSTLTGNKKEQFDRAKKKTETLESLAESLKQIQNEKKKS